MSESTPQNQPEICPWPRPKKLKKLPVCLTEEEINAFFGVISNPVDTMMFRCLYYLGLRVSELLKSNPSAWNLKEGVFVVAAEISKNKAERRIPIPVILLKTLKAYLTLVGTEVPLFPYHRVRVWQLCKIYAAKAGISKNVHPHTFRHSYLTRVYEETDDIRLCQELAGHKNLSTTSVYTHVGDKKKRRGIEGVFDR